ncbi:putative tyrosyl-tRNA synthetase mitochondrial precursor [Sphaerosporella brunnea]|uniref:Tyrosine--tRNA ligase n=1 Tax=Sphaerosporella brunnea TaxID=1250544 RepID=A0A5J5F855_9PEZI|nr:putative tyrosyl-tRNA synthetase mitochondrial precursor [Sphaerosporella brunnea]
MRHLVVQSLCSARPVLRPVATRFRGTRWQSQAAPRSLVTELQDRGLVESITGPEGQLSSLVSQQKITLYAGVDPTASSLHVGHLLPLMNLLHFYLNGHHAIGLVGKATASVGDPSGRTTERNSIEALRLRNQFSSLWTQIDKFFSSGTSYAISRGYNPENFGKRELVTNGDWLEGLGLVEFLSTVGRHVRVGQMLARESVKARMESAQGINYAEFTYQLLQSYDFWWLNKHKGCRLQVGGNDQYGNITAGIDLISRLRKSSGEAEGPSDTFDPAYGLTVPLLTTASGAKFGKSAGNAVWLDETLTSPFELYQYFVKLPDEVVEKHLKLFTLLPPPEISAAVAKHAEAPEMRSAQHLLAREVVTLIHGPQKAQRAQIQTQLLFPSPGAKHNFSADDIVDAFSGEMVDVPRNELVGEVAAKIMRRVAAVKSKSEAENVIRAGGVYWGLEGRRVEDTKAVVAQEWLLDGKVLVLRVGKGKFVVVRAV